MTDNTCGVHQQPSFIERGKAFVKKNLGISLLFSGTFAIIATVLVISTGCGKKNKKNSTLTSSIPSEPPTIPVKSSDDEFTKMLKSVRSDSPDFEEIREEMHPTVSNVKKLLLECSSETPENNAVTGKTLLSLVQLLPSPLEKNQNLDVSLCHAFMNESCSRQVKELWLQPLVTQNVPTDSSKVSENEHKALINTLIELFCNESGVLPEDEFSNLIQAIPTIEAVSPEVSSDVKYTTVWMAFVKEYLLLSKLPVFEQYVSTLDSILSKNVPLPVALVTSIDLAKLKEFKNDCSEELLTLIKDNLFSSPIPEDKKSLLTTFVSMPDLPIDIQEKRLNVFSSLIQAIDSPTEELSAEFIESKSSGDLRALGKTGFAFEDMDEEMQEMIQNKCVSFDDFIDWLPLIYKDDTFFDNLFKKIPDESVIDLVASFDPTMMGFLSFLDDYINKNYSFLLEGATASQISKLYLLIDAMPLLKNQFDSRLSSLKTAELNPSLINYLISDDAFNEQIKALNKEQFVAWQSSGTIAMENYSELNLKVIISKSIEYGFTFDKENLLQIKNNPSSAKIGYQMTKKILKDSISCRNLETFLHFHETFDSNCIDFEYVNNTFKTILDDSFDETFKNGYLSLLVNKFFSQLSSDQLLLICDAALDTQTIHSHAMQIVNESVLYLSKDHINQIIPRLPISEITQLNQFGEKIIEKYGVFPYDDYVGFVLKSKSVDVFNALFVNQSTDKLTFLLSNYNAMRDLKNYAASQFPTTTVFSEKILSILENTDANWNQFEIGLNFIVEMNAFSKTRPFSDKLKNHFNSTAFLKWISANAATTNVVPYFVTVSKSIDVSNRLENCKTAFDLSKQLNSDCFAEICSPVDDFVREERFISWIIQIFQSGSYSPVMDFIPTAISKSLTIFPEKGIQLFAAVANEKYKLHLQTIFGNTIPRSFISKESFIRTLKPLLPGKDSDDTMSFFKQKEIDHMRILCNDLWKQLIEIKSNFSVANADYNFSSEKEFNEIFQRYSQMFARTIYEDCVPEEYKDNSTIFSKFPWPFGKKNL